MMNDDDDDDNDDDDEHEHGYNGDNDEHIGIGRKGIWLHYRNTTTEQKYREFSLHSQSAFLCN